MTTDYSEIEHSPRIVAGWPEEVKYRMFVAYEYAYHAGVRPRGNAPFRLDRTGPGAESDGIETRHGDPESYESNPTSHLNVAGARDPSKSLGVRLWHAGDPEMHDVYHEPVEETGIEEPPDVTMGVVKFDDESDRSVEVSEFGRRFTRDARITIPVWHHHLNDIPAPKGGDLVEFWADSWEELGVFYDVDEVWRDGFVQSSSYFVNWGAELSRNDEFVPERRLLGA